MTAYTDDVSEHMADQQSADGEVEAFPVDCLNRKEYQRRQADPDTSWTRRGY